LPWSNGHSRNLNPFPGTPSIDRFLGNRPNFDAGLLRASVASTDILKQHYQRMSEKSLNYASLANAIFCGGWRQPRDEMPMAASPFGAPECQDCTARTLALECPLRVPDRPREPKQREPCLKRGLFSPARFSGRDSTGEYIVDSEATAARIIENAGVAAVKRSRIMYIELKIDGVTGPARIGRVAFSKTGKTLYYAGKTFERLTPCGYKSNYRDVESGDRYWISGCRRDGNDGLYGGCDAEIDEDDRHEYWTLNRQRPENVGHKKVDR